MAGLAVVAVAAAVTATTPHSVLGRGAYLVGFAGVVAAAWLGLRRASVAGRWPWAMVASALTSWLAGDLVWTGLCVWQGHDPGLSLADGFWLAGYPCMGVGIVLMVRRRARQHIRAGIQDGLTLTTAAAIAAWQYLVVPGLDTTAPWLTVLVGALYPLGDIVLLAAVLFLVLSPGHAGWPTRFLVGGTVLTLALDVGFTVLPDYWSDTAVDRLNGVVLLANTMVMLAVRHRDRDELVTPVPAPVATLHPARVLFLGAALLTAPLMAVTRGSMGNGERVLLLAGTAVTIGFTLARFTGAVREQARAQRLLAHRADHDELTGLANRRVLTDRLERDFQPVEDTVLLYLDLDGFKAVNDNHGHAAGDAVLVEVARRLRAAVRASDLTARLGGDEFAVLCFGTGPPAARELADRLRRAVCEPIEVDGRLLRIGASIGLATGLGCGSGDELISQADHAMFHAKRGRAPVA